MSNPETPYRREEGYPERYRDRRFAVGSGQRTNRLEVQAIRQLLAMTDGSLDTPWLDAPCGAGRLSDLLPGPVVRSDRSLAMLQACQGYLGLSGS